MSLLILSIVRLLPFFLSAAIILLSRTISCDTTYDTTLGAFTTYYDIDTTTTGNYDGNADESIPKTTLTGIPAAEVVGPDENDAGGTTIILNNSNNNSSDDNAAIITTTEVATSTTIRSEENHQTTVKVSTEENRKIVSSTSKPRVRYDGYQVLNVATVNSKERRKIQELEKQDAVEKLNGYVTGVHLLIKKENVPIVKQTLENNSMAFEVLMDDLQRAIDTENPPIDEDSFDNRKGHKLTFQHYHRMSDIHGYLDYLSATRSDYVSVETIGTSGEGRPLKVIKISSGKSNAPALWVDGGIHAREWIAVSTVLYIVNELTENRDKLDEELRGIDYYFLPIVNPDGYEYSHERERLWRKNRRRNFGSYCAGVDLNRNWAYEWGGKGSGKVACGETYQGPNAASEPETKAISKYILANNSQFKGYITFHSYGQYILYPWGYAKKYTADHDALDRVGRLMASAIKQESGNTYTVGNSASLLYAASGAADDWAKGIAKIKYTYTIELRDTGRHGFILPASEIVSTGKEGFAAVKTISKEFYT